MDSRVRYTRPFDGCDLADWEQEYFENVQAQSPVRKSLPSAASLVPATGDQTPFDPWSERWLGVFTEEDPLKGLLR